MSWKYREVQLTDDESIGDSGTQTIDINVTDPITELIVRFKATNAASILDDQPPELQITKIEIVDGGQSYWSLNGPMAVAQAVFEKGKWPPCWYDEQLSVNQHVHIPLLFGRYVGDPEYGFVPARLKNPQLKFTWADQAGYLDDSLTLGVTARVMEGAPHPPSCLMWKEVEAFVSASSGVKSIDLPVDHPYRRMMIRSRKAGELIDQIVTHLKMDCDVGKFVPFDLAVSEWQDLVKQEFGPYSLRKLDMFDTNGSSEAWLEGDTIAFAEPEGAALMVRAYATGWSFINQDVYYHDGTDRSNSRCDVWVQGYFPHSTWAYQFGLKDVPASWFPTSEYGEIKLKLTQAIASANVSVAVQQPRTLP